MVRVLWFVALLLLPGSAVGAQELIERRELLTLMNDRREAVQLYRQGRWDEAVKIVGRRTASLNHLIAQRVISWHRSPEPDQRDSMERGVPLWDPPLMVGLAAIHMELALRVYTERGSIETYRDNVRTAQMLIDYVASRGDAPKHFIDRWTLAIGATAQGDGNLWMALELLEDRCDLNQAHVDLLIACAAAEESLARLPAHALLSMKDEQWEQVVLGDETQSRAVAQRNRRIGRARRALERALERDPASTEAQLRLARIRMVLGDNREAVALLTPLVKNRDARLAFLARLFLGTLRVRMGEHAAAVAILEQAIALVPSAQSAYVALADAHRRSGRGADAVAVVERMLAAPSTPPDPWGSYPYGLFWISGDLIAALRAEASR